MRNRFDKAIAELHEDLVKMSGVIESSISKAMHALKESDFELAREVAESEVPAHPAQPTAGGQGPAHDLHRFEDDY